MIHCSACGKSRDTKETATGLLSLPRGWKRSAVIDGQSQTFCDRCWDQEYVLRSVAIPIAKPIDRDWKELQAALDECWSHATSLANWAITEFAKADVVRQPGMSNKMPPMPRIDLYHRARDRFALMDSKSLHAILNHAFARYRSARHGAVWINAERLPRYRYPVPYPLKSESWSILKGDGGEFILNARLAGERWLLKLRGGHQFRPQQETLRQLIEGTAHRCEATLTRADAGGSHRATLAQRDPGGGTRRNSIVMARLVVWLPRKKVVRQKTGTMNVRTGPDALLSATHSVNSTEAVFNADHVRRHIVAHSRQLQRLRRDTAALPRQSARRLNVDSFRNQICEKQHRRLDSTCREAAAFIARLAVRLRVATVAYDDTDHSYVPAFPWGRLRFLLQEKLDAENIRLVIEGAEASTTPVSRDNLGDSM